MRVVFTLSFDFKIGWDKLPEGKTLPRACKTERFQHCQLKVVVKHKDVEGNLHIDADQITTQGGSHDRK